jgi:hypothetical protein
VPDGRFCNKRTEKSRSARFDPTKLALGNEREHVDRVRLEYHDPNDAGVLPARGPALVFARNDPRVQARLHRRLSQAEQKPVVKRAG